MVALDLDGTLLTSDKTISKTNELALKKIHDAGIKVVLCTGRPINAIWRFIEQLGLTEAGDYTITFNGALVVHNNDKAELAKSGMQKQSLQPLHDFVQAQHAPLDILDFEQVYQLTDLKPSMYKQQFKGGIDFVPSSFDKLSTADLYSKAIVCDEPEWLDHYQANIDDQLRSQYHIVRSQPQIMEFLAPEMDKVVGLKALLDHFDMDFTNLMAFGDAENDLGMISHANIGVVMQNGQDKVKQAGDVVTGDNDDDGVAQYVEQYFGKNAKA
ncbi:Cof-like hydrolase [Lentilactobacillus rapi DSM 19907 = JCM 15042]|nr:Cof-type HAD-IIB family hydrolase [Lentilactobacillus rapi]KRL16858.1 Cof-like hydrolase [Lentilactobacillus rapi DSM 19907 = JCM 15042]